MYHILFHATAASAPAASTAPAPVPVPGTSAPTPTAAAAAAYTRERRNKLVLSHTPARDVYVPSAAAAPSNGTTMVPLPGEQVQASGPATVAAATAARPAATLLVKRIAASQPSLESERNKRQRIDSAQPPQQGIAIARTWQRVQGSVADVPRRSCDGAPAVTAAAAAAALAALGAASPPAALSSAARPSRQPAAAAPGRLIAQLHAPTTASASRPAAQPAARPTQQQAMAAAPAAAPATTSTTRPPTAVASAAAVSGPSFAAAAASPGASLPRRPVYVRKGNQLQRSTPSRPLAAIPPRIIKRPSIVASSTGLSKLSLQRKRSSRVWVNPAAAATMAATSAGPLPAASGAPVGAAQRRCTPKRATAAAAVGGASAAASSSASRSTAGTARKLIRVGDRVYAANGRGGLRQVLSGVAGNAPAAVRPWLQTRAVPSKPAGLGATMPAPPARRIGAARARVAETALQRSLKLARARNLAKRAVKKRGRCLHYCKSGRCSAPPTNRLSAEVLPSPFLCSTRARCVLAVRCCCTTEVQCQRKHMPV